MDPTTKCSGPPQQNEAGLGRILSSRIRLIGTNFIPEPVFFFHFKRNGAGFNLSSFQSVQLSFI